MLTFAICAGGAGLSPAAAASLATFFEVRCGTATGGRRCGPEAHARSTISECLECHQKPAKSSQASPFTTVARKPQVWKNHQPCATRPERAASNSAS